MFVNEFGGVLFSKQVDGCLEFGGFIPRSELFGERVEG
jgi:hypothetical protein